MKNGITFKDVCDFLKKDDPTLIEAVDKLSGLVLLLSAVFMGTEAVSALSILGANGELIKMGKSLFNNFVGPKSKDPFDNYNRMEMAYCLICYTSFFEALDNLFLKIRNIANLESDNDLLLLRSTINDLVKDNIPDSDNKQLGADPYIVCLPHPVDDIESSKERIKVVLYRKLTEGVLQLIEYTAFWAKSIKMIEMR